MTKKKIGLTLAVLSTLVAITGLFLSYLKTGTWSMEAFSICALNVVVCSIYITDVGRKAEEKV